MIRLLMEAVIKEHRAELLEVLREVQKDAAKGRLQRFPTRWSPSVLAQLRGLEKEPLGIGHCVRQIHDFYGWMAKASAKRGKCAGTLYRTVGYLGIDRMKRDGSKQPSRNVHIEHTVPVCVLVQTLAAALPHFRTAADLHRFLIERSVCVALSHTEERWLGEAKVPSKSNCAFDSNGAQQHDYPFRRYTPLTRHATKQGSEFAIINVVTGEQVDLQSFSFADHVNTLKMASRLAMGRVEPSVYSLELFGMP
jgi:hypothetical protein